MVLIQNAPEDITDKKAVCHYQEPAVTVDHPLFFILGI